MTSSPLPLSFLEALAREAGDLMTRGFSAAGVVRHFKDEGTKNETPVTQWDLAVNDLVIQKIRGFLTDPGLSKDVSVEAEEKSDLRAGARFRVVCDPIDGTFAYAHGIPVSTFALAVLDDDVPVAAVIHDPFGKLLCSAVKGAGAFANGERLRVSSAASFSARTTIGAVWWNTSGYNVGQLAADLPRQHNAAILNLLSISYMGAKTACGQLAGCVFPGDNAHDVAPTHLLVEEAGGVVSDCCGEPISYKGKPRGFIAAGPALHGQLVDAVRALNA